MKLPRQGQRIRETKKRSDNNKASASMYFFETRQQAKEESKLADVPMV
jgi:hypothetical protein